MPLKYELIRKDPTSDARLGMVHTPHGGFDTPAFMVVGTQGTPVEVLGRLVQTVVFPELDVWLGVFAASTGR